ncbi:uncharacterized protein LOC105157998 isoform X2 [Sesamum indicum]|uniref:Uncharacterized protein LOC105157998 isoform X2 n=1 Tax=Sesamum indicum TaxID=4182 RepID=A0A8M8UX32_SESIN|nr:uncharacterized protein LOC105157998 isoform X2 [Sesamum indicum]
MPVSEMTYWWDCDDELMFSVFHMWAEKYIRKTFSIARSILVRPYGWSTRSDSSSKRIGPARTSSRSPQRIRRIGWRTRLFIGGRGLRQSASTKRSRRRSSVDHPKQMELFERCYKKKENDSWSGPMVVEVAMLEDRQPQLMADDLSALAKSEVSMAMTEQQMWLATIEGKNKGRVFGLGSEAHVSSRTFTSPSPLHFQTQPWRTASTVSR